MSMLGAVGQIVVGGATLYAVVAVLGEQGDEHSSSEPSTVESPAGAGPASNSSIGNGRKAPRWRGVVNWGLRAAAAALVCYEVHRYVKSRRSKQQRPAQLRAGVVQPQNTSAQTAPWPVDAQSQAGGIPLKDVVRFRERQWFRDELEAAKAGDSGSMVRLAKMHLTGAGCPQDLDAAKYWVRKARQAGAWVSLEELILDGPDPPPLHPSMMPPGIYPEGPTRSKRS